MPLKQSLLILLCAVLIGATGCKQNSGRHEATPQPPRPPARVKTITVHASVPPWQQEAVGTVAAVRQATIAAKVTGVIKEMAVTLGSRVQKGAVLARLSADEITARVSQAETQLAQASRNLEREQRLLAQNAAAGETVKSLEEAQRLAHASLREARAMAGYTTITAPFAGVVTRKMAEAGDLATPGMPLLLLETDQQLRVETAVAEGVIQGIKIGDQLPIRIPAAGFAGTGVVAEMAPAADSGSLSTMVKLDIAVAVAMRPGQYARVGLPGDGARALMVPEAAVQRFGQMEKLFVVEKNTARLRLVRTGQRRDGLVEIVSGLQAEEQVVVTGIDQLVDGQSVQVEP
ncbi:MAG: efflux RND transporter periplasmic adaptor subunit [Desulfobulbaceae bacterium]|nr:efflux RND transporter periplasmic adaptor subunit [Desulfobulbaceae bacterium]